MFFSQHGAVHFDKHLHLDIAFSEDIFPEVFWFVHMNHAENT